jgi:hypothetical protein
MPNEAVLGNLSGDVTLVASDHVDVDIKMTTGAISFDVAGRVGKKAGTIRNVLKQTIAGPAIPGAGTTWYILQAACEAPSTADGTVTLKTSAAAYPAPDAGCIEILRSGLPSTANLDLLDDDIRTPDTW